MINDCFITNQNIIEGQNYWSQTVWAKKKGGTWGYKITRKVAYKYRGAKKDVPLDTTVINTNSLIMNIGQHFMHKYAPKFRVHMTPRPREIMGATCAVRNRVQGLKFEFPFRLSSVKIR